MANKEIREIEIRVDTVGTERARKYLKQAEKDESNLTKAIEREAKKRQRILEQEQLAINKASKRATYSRRRKGLRMADSQEAISFGRRRTGSYKGMGRAEKDSLATAMWEGRIRAPYKRANLQRSAASKFTSKTRSSHAYVGSMPALNRMGVRGNWNKINASNSMFNTDQSTPGMRKIQADESKLLGDWLKAKDAHNASIEKSKAREVAASARIARATEKEAAKAEAKAMKDMMDSNLRQGQQQQSDYFARARSNMSKYKKNQEALKGRAKTFKDAQKSLFEVRNSLGSVATVATQAVGELTMFAGAITMVGFMGTAAMMKLMAVGDAFAKSESDFLVGAGFRNSLIQKGGISSVAKFDRANELNQRFSGMNQFESGAMLARAGTQIREMGGSVDSSIANLVAAAHGSAAITGETADKTMSKILEVAKKGKGTDKLGIAELKLSKNMDANLEIIADAIKKDPIAGAILRRGTIASAMQRVRSAPGQLMGEVRARHGEQVSRIFNRVGDSIMNAAKDPEVIKQWSRVLTNMEEVVKIVFTDDNMKKAAIGATKWAAELTVAGGNLMLGLKWFLENSEKVLGWIETAWGIWWKITAFKFGVGVVKLFSDIFNVVGQMDKLAVDFGVATKGSVSMMMGAMTFAVSSAWEVYRGIQQAEKWGVGKTNAGVSSFIGGTGSGMSGALTNAARWGVGGAAIGSFIPVVGTAAGGIIGAGIGGITGYFGGEALAKSAHESMYGQTRIPLNSSLDGSLPGTGFQQSPTSFAPAYNNPNARVIVVHGEVNLDSKLHFTEDWMIGGAGEINY